VSLSGRIVADLGGEPTRSGDPAQQILSFLGSHVTPPSPSVGVFSRAHFHGIQHGQGADLRPEVRVGMESGCHPWPARGRGCARRDSREDLARSVSSGRGKCRRFPLRVATTPQSRRGRIEQSVRGRTVAARLSRRTACPRRRCPARSQEAKPCSVSHDRSALSALGSGPDSSERESSNWCAKLGRQRAGDQRPLRVGVLGGGGGGGVFFSFFGAGGGGRRGGGGGGGREGGRRQRRWGLSLSFFCFFGRGVFGRAGGVGAGGGGGRGGLAIEPGDGTGRPVHPDRGIRTAAQKTALEGGFDAFEQLVVVQPPLGRDDDDVGGPSRQVGVAVSSSRRVREQIGFVKNHQRRPFRRRPRSLSTTATISARRWRARRESTTWK